MSSTDPAKKLQALLKKLSSSKNTPEPAVAPDHPSDDPVLRELVHSFLVWEASLSKAAIAMKKLDQTFVDCNELRVSLREEIIGVIGARYPMARERSARLRAVLNDLYEQKHETTLTFLTSMPKREARNFLAGLDGMPPFVASRVALVALGIHAVPVDERVRKALLCEGALNDDLDVSGASGWLERQIRAEEAPVCWASIEHWCENAPATKPRSRAASSKTSKATSKKKPSRKKTSRKSG